MPNDLDDPTEVLSPEELAALEEDDGEDTVETEPEPEPDTDTEEVADDKGSSDDPGDTPASGLQGPDWEIPEAEGRAFWQRDGRARRGHTAGRDASGRSREAG